MIQRLGGSLRLSRRHGIAHGALSEDRNRTNQHECQHGKAREDPLSYWVFTHTCIPEMGKNADS